MNGSLRGLQGLQLTHTEYCILSGQANELIDVNFDRDSVSRVIRHIYD